MKHLRPSIVTRLVLLVLAVGIPLSVILAWSLRSQFHSDITIVESRAANIVNAIAARTETTLDQTQSLLMGIARRPAVQAMDRFQCDPFLANLRDSLPQFANINVMNRHWELVCSATLSNPNLAYKSKHQDVFEKMVATNDMVISPPFLGPLTGRRVVFAAYPVKDAKNNIIGAVTAPIDLAKLASSISGGSLLPNTIVKIIDGNGYVVTSYPDTDGIGKPAQGVFASVVGKQAGTLIESGHDGIERVYAYTPVNGADWVAVSGLPTAWVFADYQHHRNQVLFALALVLGFAALLAYIIARQIVRPIRMLQQDARILANGDHGHRSRVTSDDEIGQLAATFNDMAQTLETEEAEHNQAELNIRHLNRVYAVLSQINALIVRVQDREELFTDACKVAADAGGFRMSMIVIVDRDTKQLVSVTTSGKNEELLSAVKGLLATREGMQKSIVSMAVNSKQAVISNNTNEDPRLVFGTLYAEAGVNSMVVLPLIVSDEAVGVIALYAREENFFQDDELILLRELAGDIAFAIDHIDKQEQLNFLAYYDVLTGLANRSLFLERLAQYIRSAGKRGHPLAIGLIDLERFKNINDSLGRPAGDALLKQVATWMTEKAKDASLIARIDVDHFAIILPEVKSDGSLANLVENLMADFLEHPYTLNEAVLRVSIKLGIALFPDDGSDADTLMRNAEAALKKAKASGDRYLFYTQKMTAAVAGKLVLENQLRDAIDKEEFVLYYQPKVNLASGEVTGAEALIRWNDPRTGLVPPNTFIPILEETGLIYEVGRWALHKAIEDYIRWRDAGFEIGRIAVNVSPLQLRKNDFSAVIEQALATDPRVAAGLELEITENLIMENIEQSIVALHAIRAMGVHIAIDDFGTGFSSLSYLARLPLDTLKIDRSFVSDMHKPEGLELVSTIIRVAHALKLLVVAEGVETEEQARQLGSLDCDQIQGYLFSKPVPADSFEAQFLTRSRPVNDNL